MSVLQTNTSQKLLFNLQFIRVWVFDDDEKKQDETQVTEMMKWETTGQKQGTNLLDTKLLKKNRIGVNTNLKTRQIYSLEAVA